jgi:MYXO-CTERM domain-containing protein
LIRALALLAFALGGIAHADQPKTTKIIRTTAATAVPHAQAVRVLYFNRCVGGCLIKKGGLDDARLHASIVPDGPEGAEFLLQEFEHGDVVWNDFMQCVREVYSPFNVEVTDQLPTPGVPYNEGIIAGRDNDLNESGFFGVAAVNGDCTSRSFALSFTFANDIGPNALFLCSVAAQETAHSFGLDHSFEYLDGRSACNDPMSYRGDCGGQRFFRNEPARCGEYAPNSCGACGSTQNTHTKLTTVIGVGTPLTAPPTLSVTSPITDTTITNSSSVVATAYSQRGIFRMELLLNGYKWAETKGVGFGPNGQPEAAYSLVLPADVPDGVIDIVVRAKDDLGISTDSDVITVTKGAPCATADTCAEGQLCEAGKCFWEPAAGELGDECTFKQFCKTELCQSIDSGEARCTQGCVLGIADSCPESYQCLANSATGGVCWPSSDLEKGCLGCSNSRGGSTQGLLFAIGLGFLVFWRRRR